MSLLMKSSCAAADSVSIREITLEISGVSNEFSSRATNFSSNSCTWRLSNPLRIVPMETREWWTCTTTLSVSWERLLIHFSRLENSGCKTDSKVATRCSGFLIKVINNPRDSNKLGQLDESVEQVPGTVLDLFVIAEHAKVGNKDLEDFEQNFFLIDTFHLDIAVCEECIVLQNEFEEKQLNQRMAHEESGGSIDNLAEHLIEDKVWSGVVDHSFWEIHDVVTQDLAVIMTSNAKVSFNITMESWKEFNLFLTSWNCSMDSSSVPSSSSSNLFLMMIFFKSVVSSSSLVRYEKSICSLVMFFFRNNKKLPMNGKISSATSSSSLELESRTLTSSDPMFSTSLANAMLTSKSASLALESI
ncbi:hypothetical protein OGAPHI_001833 [Ogataea philodendri]|uniref:Uncharacterized protein n=1 Tax=Ogataea philodendri TaxID=1378263 RepID=A0A9P8PAU4_9ASCO|nr:uncharacterized protein OGAPHI_001833 [Ogataea philodendri]KAH3668079.1 hypothetical protein OGAPHI_001833 [Ogataea philodendri]